MGFISESKLYFWKSSFTHSSLSRGLEGSLPSTPHPCSCPYFLSCTPQCVPSFSLFFFTPVTIIIIIFCLWVNLNLSKSNTSAPQLFRSGFVSFTSSLLISFIHSIEFFTHKQDGYVRNQFHSRWENKHGYSDIDSVGSHFHNIQFKRGSFPISWADQVLFGI